MDCLGGVSPPPEAEDKFPSSKTLRRSEFEDAEGFSILKSNAHSLCRSLGDIEDGLPVDFDGFVGDRTDKSDIKFDIRWDCVEVSDSYMRGVCDLDLVWLELVFDVNDGARIGGGASGGASGGGARAGGNFSVIGGDDTKDDSAFSVSRSLASSA